MAENDIGEEVILTRHARLVLFDAEAAIAEMPRSDSNWQRRVTDRSVDRRRIFCVLTLLRSVGLLLKGVDYETGDQYLKEAIDQKWSELNRTRPKPDVFHNFVDQWRYNVVHLYRFPEGESEVYRGTGYPTYEYNSPEPDGKAGVCLNYQALDAVRFWKQYLDDVDKLAAQSRANGT